MDLLEQFDDGGGRELDACQAVEPKSGAGKAELHPDDAVIVSFEIPGLHVLLAVRAADRGTGISAGHGMAAGQEGDQRWTSRIDHSFALRTRWSYSNDFSHLHELVKRSASSKQVPHLRLRFETTTSLIRLPGCSKFV